MAWTYRSKAIRKNGKWFVGINVGAGLFYNHYQHYGVYYSYDDCVAVSGGVDLAFPIGQSVNLGLYSSIGYGDAGAGSLLVGVGPLMLVNFRGGGALYFGGGWCYTGSYSYGNDSGNGFGVRMGFKFKDGFYLFGDYNYTLYDYSYWNNNYYSYSYNWGRNYAILLHLGYSF